MPVGFSKACRTCLTLDGTLISIFDSISYDGRGRVTDMIKDITKIKPIKSDGLPELVCQTCLNEINRCYSFKVKCLNSDSTLRKLFATEEELEASTQQQVMDNEKEYKPIIQNLIRIHGSDEVEQEFEQPVKIKTEKDPEDQSFGYFVITSVCSQIDQTNEASGKEIFPIPQGYIKEEINYEIDSYNTSPMGRLTYSGDVGASDQSHYFDNISFELPCPQVKLEPEEPLPLEPPVINATIRPRFECTKCSKDFLYTSSLKKHMRSHNSKPYTCSTCCRGFKLSAQLRNHIDIIHRNIKPFKCEECPRTFSFPSKLKEHLRSHKGNKYYKSNYSPSSTFIEKKENEEVTQQAAQQSSTNITDEKTQELKYDEKTNVTNINLDESIIEQPFAWMSERFTRRSARIVREEIKTPDSEKNQIQPNSSVSEPICIKIITRQSEKLNQTDYSIDGQDHNPVDDKNSPEGSRQLINCPHCPKVFKYLSRFNEHVVCHSDARPFDCVNCGKFFKTTSQLSQHIKTTHKKSAFRSRRKPFSRRRRGLKRKNVKNKCVDNTLENINSLENTDYQLVESKETQANVTNYTGSQDDQVLQNENQDALQNETNKDQLENVIGEENTNENNHGLPENETNPTVNNINKCNRSKRSKQLIQEHTDSVETQIQSNTSASESSRSKIITRQSEKLAQIECSSNGQYHNPVDDKNSTEGSRKYICPHCNKVFKYLSRYNEHVVCHSDARPFDCVNCGKFFKSPGQLARHIKTTHQGVAFRGRRKQFSRRYGLRRKNINKKFVRNTVDPGGSNSLEHTDDQIVESENKDEQANVMYNDPSDVRGVEYHDDQINETSKDKLGNVNDGKHTNEIIHSVPENETNPTVTIKQISNKIGSPSENPENLPNPTVIEESFETEKIISNEPRTYLCEQCDETFIVSAQFYKHMRAHGIERPFICSLCGRGFKNCGNLKSHILITHKKIRPFKCNDCKLTFSCKSNLKRHLTSRIWTHSCTKDFSGRRGGTSKKKIKNKKLLKVEDDNNDLNLKQSLNISSIEHKTDSEIVKDDKDKQKCLTDEINEKLKSSHIYDQEPEVSMVKKDETQFTEPEPVEISPNLSKPEPETDQLKQPQIESLSNQVLDKSVNKSPKNLECPTCKKVFQYVSYLKKHMQSHSDERNFICTICDKAFKYKVSLKSHNRITHAKYKPYKCDKCPQAFVNEYTYRVHRNSHNKANKRKTKTKRRRALEKPSITESTSTSIDQSISAFKEEVVGVEMKNDRTFCSVCSMSILSDKLTVHMQQHHNTTESTCAQVNSLNHSDQAVNPIPETITTTNSFECLECNKVFLFASYLKKHMRTHNDERPHVCLTCGKAFKDHWRLRSHVKEKHNSYSKKIIHRKKRRNLNREKPLATVVGNVDGQDQIDKVEETSEILNVPQENLNEVNSVQLEIQNAATISGEVEGPNIEIEKPQCALCNKVFKFASQLETHMRTHTGERPYECPTCYKTFTQNGHLKNHILINHKKIMPFQCSVCFRGFASGYNMRAHEKTHFNEGNKKVKKNDKNSTETSKETVPNPQNDLQNQVIQDFEKLGLHPLFGSMSSNQDESISTEQNSFYPCPNCTKTFVFHSDLNEHMKTHSANARPFDCSICFKSFKKEAYLKIHTQMSHTKTRNYKCSECDRVFLTFYILNKHMRSHKGKKIRSKAKSKRGHKKRVNLLKQTEYSAEQVGSYIEQNQTNEQQDEVAAETINFTNEQIQSQTAVARNVQITCALCSLPVDSESLTDHMKQCLSISQSAGIQLKSEPLEDQQQSDHPLFERFSNQDIQDEQLTDTGMAKQCLECKREFSTFALLADHMMTTHNVERPFICKTCDKGFKKNAHLRSHIMIVHKRILPYKCLECSRNFSSKYNLQVHLKTNHNGKGGLRKTSSKRRVVVKKSYYKDPPYHAKPIHNEIAHQTISRERQRNEHKEDTINYSIENQMEHSEIQFSYARNENKIRCTLCFVSVHTEHLSKHMQEFHNLPDSLTCMAIKKEPLEESEQSGHKPLEIETSQTETSQIDITRRLQCPTCDKEFIHLSRLNEHMRAHSDERPFICLFCGKTFKRHGHLTTHIAICHTKAKPFKCKECQQTFSSSLDLNVHLKTHINEQLPTDFLVDRNLQNEINLEPLQSDEPLPPCNTDAEFTGECTAEEAQQCTLCPTVFKSISHLMEHMKVHTSDQPFICSLCGKGFNSNDDLITHRSISHNKSKPYQCDQCVRKFRTSLELKKHLLIHTGNCQRMQKLIHGKRQNAKHNPDPNNQESLSYSGDLPQCHICKKDFSNNWVLKEHMKCHASVRPFTCPICGHGFNKKYNLKIHIMAHKKIKPFKCHYCPQSYCTNAGRNNHMRTHTYGRNPIDMDSLNSENLTL